MASSEETVNITADIQPYPTKKYQCDSCIMYQDRLLEEGDGSQVVCTHMDDDDDSEADLPTMKGSSSTNDTAGETSTMKKRKRDDDDDGGDFINESEFESLIKRLKPAISWKDLPLKTTYKIVDISQPINTRYGAAHVITLKPRQGDEYRVWLKPYIHKRIKQEEENGSVINDIYLKCNGKAECRSDSSKSYHAVDIVTRHRK